MDCGYFDMAHVSDQSCTVLCNSSVLCNSTTNFAIHKFHFKSPQTLTEIIPSVLILIWNLIFRTAAASLSIISRLQARDFFFSQVDLMLHLVVYNTVYILSIYQSFEYKLACIMVCSKSILNQVLKLILISIFCQFPSLTLSIYRQKQ